MIFGSWVTHVVNGAVFNLKYDVVDDFEPVALLGTNPLLIVARKTMPANDLKELIAWMKANGDKATQGITGAGTALHIAGLSFKRATGTTHPFVSYRGGSLAMQDLVSGQIDMMIDIAANSLPQVASGAIKAYAVTDTRRLLPRRTSRRSTRQACRASTLPCGMPSGRPRRRRRMWSASSTGPLSALAPALTCASALPS